jgi:predicted ATPase
MMASCFSHSDTEQAYFPFKELLNTVVNPQLDPGNSSTKVQARKILLRVTEELLGCANELAASFIPSWKLIQSVSAFALEKTGTLEKLKSKMIDATETPPQSLDDSRIVQQLGAFLEASAKVTPIHIVIDDMQWMDAASIALLQKLTISLKGSPIFFILCYRSFELDTSNNLGRHPLRQLINNVESRYGQSHIDLDELTAEERQAFSEDYLKQTVPGVSETFIEQFHLRTDGLPLYCIELLMMLQEKKIVCPNELGQWQAKSISHTQMPIAMTSVIRERVERLDIKYRKWLDIACVQGNSFYISVISQVCGVPHSDLLFEFSKMLDKQVRLVIEEDLIYLAGEIIAHYRFSHKLIQQYLYEELSQAEKQYLHLQTAGILEQLFAEHIEEKHAEIAYHYDHAMQYVKAHEHYMRASHYDYRRGAYANCVRFLTKILQRLPLLPKSAQALQEEVDALTLLTSCYIALYGYGSKEVAEANKRAEMLRRELKDDSLMFSILWKRWSNLILQGDIKQARWVVDSLMAIAGQSRFDMIAAVEAYHAAGVTEFNAGNFGKAASLLERGLSYFSAESRQEHIEHYGNDTEILLLSWLCWVFLFSGEKERCKHYRRLRDEALKRCQHQSSRAFAYVFKAMYNVFSNEPQHAFDIAQHFLENHDSDMPFWESWATIIRKWSHCRLTHHYECPEKEITAFIQSSAIWKPFLHALWADMYVETNPQAATELFARALVASAQVDIQFHAVPILSLAHAFYQSAAPDTASNLASKAKLLIDTQGARFWADGF